jgi:hypothetical protein
LLRFGDLVASPAALALEGLCLGIMVPVRHRSSDIGLISRLMSKHPANSEPPHSLGTGDCRIESTYVTLASALTGHNAAVQSPIP